MSEAPLPATIGGRYRVIRVIGQGGMGVVYEVEHANTGDRLALKVLAARLGESSQAHERFKREARASARIKSDYVVRVTDADVAPELQDAPFLVMELLDGENLERHAASRRPSPSEVVRWMRQIARAVDKAHKLGIVHRDLKPDNLFLTNRDDGPPIVKVLDFGIAKVTEDGGFATHSGQILGTPRYMAPEQASGGSGDVGPATDVFALGLIAFRLLVGEHYYRGETVIKLIAEVLHEPIRAPSSRGSTLGAGFDAWFLRCCDKDPRARFSSAEEAGAALAAALGVPHEPRVSIPDAAGVSESARLIAEQPTVSLASLTSPQSAPKEADTVPTLSGSAAHRVSTTARDEPRSKSRSLLGVGLAGAAMGAVILFAMTRPKPPVATSDESATTSPAGRSHGTDAATEARPSAPPPAASASAGASAPPPISSEAPTTSVSPSTPAPPPLGRPPPPPPPPPPASPPPPLPPPSDPYGEQK